MSVSASLQRLSIALLLLVSMDCAIAEAWDVEDNALEALFLGLHLIDWGQTRGIAMQCDNGGRFHENSLLLRRCPTLREVNLYFFSSAVIQLAIARNLHHHQRRMFIVGTILLSANSVRSNYRAGVIMHF